MGARSLGSQYKTIVMLKIAQAAADEIYHYSRVVGNIEKRGWCEAWQVPAR
jgi:hypothetical protein